MEKLIQNCECGSYCEICAPVACGLVKITDYRDDSKGYNYVTTEAGQKCNSRKGIGAGILVNVSAIDAGGLADIWTESPITGPYTDRVAFNTLKLRVVV